MELINISKTVGIGIAVLIMTGCGGSDDNTTPTVATGKAFYVDSEVQGVDYTCGSQKGTTALDGGFTFEKDIKCTFKLSSIYLRDVDASILKDGEKVYETDINRARVLQSLDSNPDIGITISDQAVAELEKEGYTSIPTDPAEIETIVQLNAANGGTYVSEKDAQEHLLNTYLSGRTLYTVEEINGPTGVAQILSTSMSFNDDLTSFYMVQTLSASGLEQTLIDQEVPITAIDGTKISADIQTPTESMSLTIEFLKLEDTYSEVEMSISEAGYSFTVNATMYFSEEDAENAFNDK